MKTKLLNFEYAHALVLKDIIGKNICGYNDWQKKYIKLKSFPYGVPKQPHITYKDKGWVSWGHWLGTKNISNSQKNHIFFDYAEAKKYVKNDITKYNILSKNKWFKTYVKNKLIASFIPTNPQRTYKDKGWVSWAEWLGTKNRQGGFSCRKYFVDESFFDQWSSDMAYILGFWFADGCMKDHRRFSIYQNKKDKYLLQNILRSIGTNYPIYDDKRGCCYFEFSSRHICESVKNMGGSCRKSLTVSFPDVPLLYLRDFIRGYFDGDGCITYDSNSKKYVSYITSGSNKFLLKIKSELKSQGINGALNNQCSIKFSAEDTVKLGRFMYYSGMNDKLALTRKRNKFLLANGITGIGSSSSA